METEGWRGDAGDGVRVCGGVGEESWFWRRVNSSLWKSMLTVGGRIKWLVFLLHYNYQSTKIFSTSKLI